MKPRYTIRCFSRVDDIEVVDHGGFPLYFSTHRRAQRRLHDLIADAGPRSIYRYDLVRTERVDRGRRGDEIESRSNTGAPVGDAPSSPGGSTDSADSTAESVGQ